MGTSREHETPVKTRSVLRWITGIGVVGLAVGVVFSASEATPSAQECADSWNGLATTQLRQSVPLDDYKLAIVHGSLAEEEYPYCSVTLLEAAREGKWQMYVRLMGAYDDLPEATREWYLDAEGLNWRIRPGTPSVNASVGQEATVRLTD